jgi:hypothetical protein
MAVAARAALRMVRTWSKPLGKAPAYPLPGVRVGLLRKDSLEATLAFDETWR